MAFILTGAAGFLWLIFWFWLYDPPDKQKRISQAEYDYIHIDDEAAADQNRRQGDKKCLGSSFLATASCGVSSPANS